MSRSLKDVKISESYPRLVQQIDGIFYDGAGNLITGIMGPQGPLGVTGTGITGPQGNTGPQSEIPYSTTEVLTGSTWINDKPVYRKVILFTVPSVIANEDTVEILHNLGIENYLRMDITAINPTIGEDKIYNFSISSMVSGVSGIVAIYNGGFIRSDADKIVFESVKSSVSTTDFYLILEYTKI